MNRLKSFVFIVTILCISGNFAYKRNYNFKFCNHEKLNVFEERCFEVTKSHTAYEKFMNAAQSYEICFKSVMDSKFVQEIRKDYELANFDPIIEKVCNKRDKLLNCMNTLMNAASVYFTDEEKPYLKTANRITESLAGYTCENMNQTSIVMTYECVLLKQNQLMTCMEKNYGELMSLKINDSAEIDAVSSQVLTCPVFKNYEDCIIDELKSCDQDIPAKVVSSIFKIVKNEVSCS